MIQEIIEFIERQPQAIARLFARYDIQAEPTPKNVGNAITVIRRPFVDDMLDLMHLNEQSGFNDDNGNPVTFTRVVDGLSRVALGASNIARDVQGKQRLLSTRNGYQVDPRGYADRDSYDDYNYGSDRILGINKTLFMILAGVALLAAIMYSTKK
ncbi:hypothetical protein IDJ77_11235 [Mucilaginibacter sp. ZT4R22]|uniref:Uncharacterized protein n=1 Tax=Mucilaginibacter pankratovii TaxID=2772110 RepID=A0ABR7WSY3_9SPHI|nr:hypothetical protein [Mucilaginibacter pankratovii]MBD1364382.1 hypothetical protein [Mucilaginibacter pankratovii]